MRRRPSKSRDQSRSCPCLDPGHYLSQITNSSCFAFATALESERSESRVLDCESAGAVPGRLHTMSFSLNYASIVEHPKSVSVSTS